MNKEKNTTYQRREFIKLVTLVGLGFSFGSCRSNEQKENKNIDTGSVSPPIKKDKKILADNVVFYKKGDQEYEKLRRVYNKRIDKYPAIVALCKNTQGVVEAIQYAKENNLPVTIKSGGHCFEGFSSNDDGMMINLSLLNQIEWLKDDVIKVGPACTLSNLYDKILPKKKIIPAGSCGSVGIGGLTLGGGYGFFSRKYGLTCDSLLEVTMVDGNGNILNSTNDAELLWACKGGGNGNFGVITEMKFKTHDAPSFFQSHRFKANNLNAERAAQILEKWFELTPNLPWSCFSAFVLNGKSLTILITDYENHTNEIEKIKKELFPIVDKITSSQSNNLASALKNYYGAQDPPYFKNASVGLYKNFTDIKDCINAALEIVTTTPGMMYQVNTLGGNIQNSVFNDNAAFAHRSYNFISELQTYWENTKQGENLMKKFKEVEQMFTSSNITAQYCNYPSVDCEDWKNAYYGENYARLQKNKNKYDPNNLIRYEQSIQNT